ncbi:MlaC/ttg2D family ABC transporter substrate-binding protein [Denitratisoma oestradiolicum]|nr:ABC transporter substrate-binding protein [Denitratisoma oestradiolicum]TWO81169.1 hypothetical protein CBW56_06085 [Denitratisoma oestradiolicum]
MKWLLGLCAGLLLAGSVLADEMAADLLVRNVTTEVLDILRKDKEIQSGSTKKAMELVENKVLPHFNFQRMTAQAVGKAWRQASPAQQKSLIEEFKTLLVRTYSNALTAYKSQVVDFKPLKAAPSDTEVTVRTEIKQAGGKPISLNYVLEKTGNHWMVIDMVIADISQVTNYRDQFRQELANGGLDGLIHSLEAKNKSAEAPAKK